MHRVLHCATHRVTHDVIHYMFSTMCCTCSACVYAACLLDHGMKVVLQRAAQPHRARAQVGELLRPRTQPARRAIARPAGAAGRGLLRVVRGEHGADEALDAHGDAEHVEQGGAVGRAGGVLARVELHREHHQLEHRLGHSVRRHDELVEEHASRGREVRTVGARDLAWQPLVRLRLPQPRLEERRVERRLHEMMHDMMHYPCTLACACSAAAPRWLRAALRNALSSAPSHALCNALGEPLRLRSACSLAEPRACRWLG